MQCVQALSDASQSGVLPAAEVLKLEDQALNELTALRQALLDQSEVFVRTLTEKLLVYALGRGLEHYDAPAVRTIARDAAHHEYRLSALLMGIVRSTPFQMRRAADPGGAAEQQLAAR